MAKKTTKQQDTQNGPDSLVHLFQTIREEARSKYEPNIEVIQENLSALNAAQQDAMDRVHLTRLHCSVVKENIQHKIERLSQQEKHYKEELEQFGHFSLSERVDEYRNALKDLSSQQITLQGITRIWEQYAFLLLSGGVTDAQLNAIQEKANEVITLGDYEARLRENLEIFSASLTESCAICDWVTNSSVALDPEYPIIDENNAAQQAATTKLFDEANALVVLANTQQGNRKEQTLEIVRKGIHLAYDVCHAQTPEAKTNAINTLEKFALEEAPGKPSIFRKFFNAIFAYVRSFFTNAPSNTPPSDSRGQKGFSKSLSFLAEKHGTDTTEGIDSPQQKPPHSSKK